MFILHATSNQGVIPQDYHVHSHFSCDSDYGMETMCRAAIKAGVDELGFSDHFDLHPLDPYREYLDLDAWWTSLRACQETFADELIIRAGIEVGEPHRFPERVEALLKDYPWDFILGSLHWVGDLCVFDHAFFKEDESTTYEHYFTELERLVAQGEFDILAHFDVVKRYGYEKYGLFRPQKYEETIRRILRLLAERDLALEINTATLRRSILEPSPDAAILAWFLEEGGRWITLGSDAHTPQTIGFGLAAIKSNLLLNGYGGLARYESRQHSIVDLRKYED